MRIAAEDVAGRNAALLRRLDAGFASGAICVARVYQHHAQFLLAVVQMALTDDERRRHDSIAGEHCRRGRRLVRYSAGEIGITAGLDAGACRCEAESARHLIIGEQRRRISHVAFTLSRMDFLYMASVDIARGDKVVLHDVNLRIAGGEHIAILGPNGCGKSTLIKAITCECYPIVRPGMEIKIFGRDRWDVQQLRKHLGVVAAELPGERTAVTSGLDAAVSGFFSSSTIWPNLVVTESMRATALEMLALMGAEYLRDRLVGEMSAGEKRRVMIARSLVHRPEMLLLDEPSNALDLSAQQELREILRKVASTTGLIMVTHHLADILPEIDRVVMMRDGRIVADGPKRELLTTPRLRELFGIELELVERNGYWHSW